MKLLLLIFLLIASPLNAETYYMSATGTQAVKGSATSGCGGAVSTMLSVAGHNAETFAAADTIILCDDGGEYKATIVPPSNGTTGSPITYQSESGVTCVINGGTAINSWTATGTNSEYSKTIATIPTAMFESGTGMNFITDPFPASIWQVHSGNIYVTSSRNYFIPSVVYSGGSGAYAALTLGSDKDSLNSGEYYYDEGTNYKLYVRAANDEDLTAQADDFVVSQLKIEGSLSASSASYNYNEGVLYVKTDDGSAPADGEITYPALDYGFNLSDVSNITVTGIQIEETKTAAIYIAASINQSNIIIDGNYLYDNALEAIRILDSATIDFSGLQITDNNILRSFSRCSTAASSICSDGYAQAVIHIYIDNGGDLEVDVARNYIDSNHTITRTTYISGGRNGITIKGCNNADDCEIYDNELTAVDHGITLYSNFYKIYRNYIHDNTDDCYLGFGNPSATAGQQFIYLNLCVNSGNNGIATGPNSVVSVLNNTIINSVNTPLIIQGVGETIENNLIYLESLTEDTDDYIVNATNVGITDDIITNNIYYLASGTVQFLEAAVEKTWSEWQSLGADSNSISGTNPNINTTNGTCVAGTSMPIKGKLQTAFTQLLAQNPTWAVGVAPALVTVSIFPVGAIANYDLCASGFAVGGVTLTGGITIQ